ncbi:hypothetical protein LJR230_004953 [Trinickia sp. LjRoot230]|uniref:hypothetical protein n=1 Tax=Trinickia sp. LjRoot230 TaxID=3342288 RepID=UPI003ECFF964
MDLQVTVNGQLKYSSNEQPVYPYTCQIKNNTGTNKVSLPDSVNVQSDGTFSFQVDYVSLSFPPPGHPGSMPFTVLGPNGATAPFSIQVVGIRQGG